MQIDKLKDLILYQSENGNVQVEVLYNNENFWLTQKTMAELFGCTIDNIGLHLKNIYKEKELNKNATTEKISVVQKEGNRNVKRKIDFYSLDAIIAVGYRVNSKEATSFRIWATNTLKEYIKKEKAKFYSGDGYSGIDYLPTDEYINFAVIKINSRSPKKDFK